MYEGKWKDNQKHGIGKMQFKKKGTYFGRPVFMRLLPKQQETRRRAVYLSEWRYLFWELEMGEEERKRNLFV